MEKLIFKQITTSKFINNFITNTNKIGKDNITEGYVQTRVNLLHQYWEKFQNNHDQLLEQATAKDLESDYFQNESYDETELAYCQNVGILKKMLEDYHPSVSLSNQENINSIMCSNITALPKMNLPQFGGDFRQWPAFFDLFKCLIDSRLDLTGSQKLYYLKTSLSGQAEQLLRNIVITDSNYKSAWEILCDRYQNTRVLVSSYLRMLNSLPTMKLESAEELKRLFDATTEAVKGLEGLGRPVNHWDDWLIFITVQKLDSLTRKDWEDSISGSTELPKFKALCSFLQNRIHTLEAVMTCYQKPKELARSLPFSTIKTKSHAIKVHYASTTTHNCPSCSGKHLLLFCPSFRQKSVAQRREFVQKEQLCFNCLRKQHCAANCPSTNRCKHCNQLHHSSLHRDNGSSVDNNTKNHSSSSNSTEVHNSIHPSPSVGSFSTAIFNKVLLATAKVILESPSGRKRVVRALLDQGSQATFISSTVANSLQLPRTKISVAVSGIGSCVTTTVKSKVSFSLRSCTSPDFQLEGYALILPKLTQVVTPKEISFSCFSHLANLQLADPNYNDDSPIDLILGADYYYKILKEGLRQGLPTAQNTSLGWILSGPMDCPNHNEAVYETKAYTTSVSIDLLDLQTLIQKFWEIEEVSLDCSSLTEEEQACEKYYNQTTTRNTDGRYVVRLPIKLHYNSPLFFGDSRYSSIKCLLAMERRFKQDSVLQTKYGEFMKEYQSLHHMEPVLTSQTRSGKLTPFYMPHHGVIREQSSTTKFRVVFNASRRSSNGCSLNDCLAAGPALQQDLTSILLRWRKHLIVFAADIKKMFRQIMVHEDDTDLQRIVWRESESEPIRDFRLLTVTYGTTSAPFLAIRTLLKLAEDEKTSFPLGCEVLQRDCYVDDILTGAEDVSSVLSLQDQLVKVLSSGGFELHKWSSNSNEILLSTNSKSPAQKHLGDLDQNITKTLGLIWNQNKDAFGFQISLPDAPSIITMRNILFDVAKLYDPLGFLSPSTILAKSKFQELWLEKELEWDSPVPANIANNWLSLRSELSQLESVSIPRWIGWHPSNCSYEIHAFADASEKAYAAVAYIRVCHELDQAQISLLCSKTKLAPIKKLSIPRLELSGAYLMARLINSLHQSFDLRNVKIYCWTDSEIVLTWLKSHPSRWKSFVSNRCSFIHELIPSASWRHVPGNSNPADCATRAVQPSLLANFDIWWQGPAGLQSPSSMWPQHNQSSLTECIDIEERPPVVASSTIIQEESQWDLLERYSTLNRLLRITAYCKRFISNLQCEGVQRNYSPLSASELENVLIMWIRRCQSVSFTTEILRLTKGKRINPTSSLLRLSPFLEKSTEAMRVGGRLHYSNIPSDAKHQFILGKTCRLSDLIIADAHQQTLHGGVSLTLNYIRQRYWIISGRDKVRRYIQRCIPCFRQRASARIQLMGILPPDRVNPSKPFLHTGIDYAGPVQVRYGPGRGRSSYKAYIALFVCMATKAIHLELVSSLTTEAFIAAYKRFISRRGRCSRIYSDNAKTFVGADRQLQNSLFQVKSQLPEQLASLLASHGTNWIFIPPNAPNFGGLWEAGVKAVKHHLKRVIGNTTLTFEEFYTLLTLVEACLNSRPLYPMSADPSDTEVLTPGHFLMGSPPLSLPEPSLKEIKVNRLTRWQLVQQLHEHFWHRWSKEYLNNLQVRTKWTSSQPNVQIGTIVLLREDQLPPSQWALGRITDVVRGPDELVRVVIVGCKGITLKRPISKICPLPLLDGTELPSSRRAERNKLCRHDDEAGSDV